MLIVKEQKLCEICSKKLAVILCDGCEKALCEDCRQFDLWSYGCGHINPKAFCQSCYEDIDMNPWGGKRPL